MLPRLNLNHRGLVRPGQTPLLGLENWGLWGSVQTPIFGSKTGVWKTRFFETSEARSTTAARDDRALWSSAGASTSANEGATDGTILSAWRPGTREEREPLDDKSSDCAESGVFRPGVVCPTQRAATCMAMKACNAERSLRRRGPVLQSSTCCCCDSLHRHSKGTTCLDDASTKQILDGPEACESSFLPK